MTPTTYQKPEIRDSNDNIIQQGAFGKNTALSNATNDGWIDYVANDLEALNTKADGALPLTGGTMTGAITINASLQEVLKRSVNNGHLIITGGDSYFNSSSIVLRGGGSSILGFQIKAYNNSNNTGAELYGQPNGTLTWNNNNVLTAANYNSYALPLSGGTMSGAIVTSTVDFIKRNADDNHLTIIGGSSYSTNAAIVLGGGSGGYNGLFQINAQNGTSVKSLVGRPDGTLQWGGNNVVVQKDENITSQVTVTTNNGTIVDKAFYKVGNVAMGYIGIKVSTAVNMGGTITGTISGFPTPVAVCCGAGFTSGCGLILNVVSNGNYTIMVCGNNLPANAQFGIAFTYATVS